jgi:hypothetical protein
MKGEAVPDADHIARQCGGASVSEDGTTIDGSAFRLKEKAGVWEEYLSVNWLEHLDRDDRQRQLELLRGVFIAKGRKLGAKSKFAVHQVGPLRDHIRSNAPDRRALDVVHEPFDDDESHSGVYGLEAEDDFISDLIAECVQEIHPGRG